MSCSFPVKVSWQVQVAFIEAHLIIEGIAGLCIGYIGKCGGE